MIAGCIVLVEPMGVIVSAKEECEDREERGPRTLANTDTQEVIEGKGTSKWDQESGGSDMPEGKGKIYP